MKNRLKRTHKKEKTPTLQIPFLHEVPFLLFLFVFSFAGLDFPSVTSNSHQTSSRYFFHSCHYNRLVAVHFPQGVGEPLETFVQTVTGGSAGRLDELERGHVSKGFGAK